MTPDRADHATWAPPATEPLDGPGGAVALAVAEEPAPTPPARVRVLEVLFLTGLAGVFLVNAVVAAVQPSDFTSLVGKSAVADWLGISPGGWLAPTIFVNDLVLGLGLVGAIWARHAVRAVILAWAGVWFFVVTLVKLTALEFFSLTRRTTMAVLVTGGAGYIGSHTVRALLEQERDVVVLDTLETGNAGGGPGRAARGRRHRRHRPRAPVVDEHGVDSVIHFAGYKNAGESMQDPGKYFANNVVGTARLLRAIEGTAVDQLRLLRLVLGLRHARAAAGERGRRRCTPRARTARASSWASRCCGGTASSAGLQWVSLRYFNASGASADALIGEDIRVTLNLVPLVMKATLGLRPPIQVFGTDFPTPDGTAVRDYIHVDDLASGHLLALSTSSGAAGRWRSTSAPARARRCARSSTPPSG